MKLSFVSFENITQTPRHSSESKLIIDNMFVQTEIKYKAFCVSDRYDDPSRPFSTLFYTLKQSDYISPKILRP